MDDKKRTRQHLQQRMNRTLAILRRLYHSTNAKQISSSYRKQQSAAPDSDSFLTYGEIDVASFLQILALTKPNNTQKSSRKFVDLGCGAGLPCVCAALSPFEFDSILGIEIVGGLVELAQTLHNKLTDELVLLSQAPIAIVSNQVPSKRFTHDDLAPIVDNILQKQLNDTCSMRVDLLASEICKVIGHKNYKSQVKKFKSFLKFLETQAPRITLSSDAKTISWSHNSTTDLCGENHLSILMTETSSFQDIATEVHEELSSVNTTSSNCLGLCLNDKALFDPFPAINYVHGSIFDYDWWSDCDVAYTASLLFTDEMMQQLVTRVLKMKAGSWFITLKLLPLQIDESVKIKLINDSFFKMSWQMARVYTYQVQ
jgi:hypothetical protein